LRQVPTKETMAEGGNEGIPAYGFVGVDAVREDEYPAIRGVAQAELRVIVDYFSFDRSASITSFAGETEKMSLVPREGIRLIDEEANGLELLDIRLTELAPGHFWLDGILFNEGEARIRYESANPDGTVREGAVTDGFFRISRAANGASAFMLEDVDDGRQFTMVVGQSGELLIWPRPSNVTELYRPLGKPAPLEMHQIKGGPYAKQVPSQIIRQATSRIVGGESVAGLDYRAALGRDKGAGKLDLKIGDLPKVGFFIHEDSSAELKILQRIVRDTEKEGFYPFGFAELSVDGDDSTVKENSDFELQIVEDTWRDAEGNLKRGRVRVFFRNVKATNPEGNAIKAYGYITFKDRNHLMGALEDFKPEYAHYHERADAFTKPLPSEEQSVSDRSGVARDPDWNDARWEELFVAHGEAGFSWLAELAKCDGGFGQISTLMGALQFATDHARSDEEKFITEKDGVIDYSESILASLAHFAAGLTPDKVEALKRPAGGTKRTGSTVSPGLIVGLTVAGLSLFGNDALAQGVELPVEPERISAEADVETDEDVAVHEPSFLTETHTFSPLGASAWTMVPGFSMPGMVRSPALNLVVLRG
ncbi:MAG: hypothetical protein HY541_01555, partial [Deltaproteobacteria bacterium]|nr:hypothetical protein [Deltaproteobacteria bacterium]